MCLGLVSRRYLGFGYIFGLSRVSNFRVYFGMYLGLVYSLSLAESTVAEIREIQCRFGTMGPENHWFRVWWIYSIMAVVRSIWRKILSTTQLQRWKNPTVLLSSSLGFSTFWFYYLRVWKLWICVGLICSLSLADWSLGGNIPKDFMDSGFIEPVKGLVELLG